MNIFGRKSYIKNGFVSVTKKPLTGNVQPHGHDFFEIEFFVGGSGEHIINGVSYPIKQNSLFLLSPASVHSILTKSSEVITVMFQCEYDGSFFDFPFLYKDASPAFYPDGHDTELILPLINELYEKHETEKEYSLLLLRCILHKISLNKNPLGQGELPLIQNVFLYIRENFRSDITLEATAAHFGFSRSYFSELFFRHTGMNFKAYLDDVRFSHAKNLLQFTSIPISEVHIRSGFQDYANFARRFKSKYKKKPTEYRKTASET